MLTALGMVMGKANATVYSTQEMTDRYRGSSMYSPTGPAMNAAPTEPTSVAKAIEAINEHTGTAIGEELPCVNQSRKISADAMNHRNMVVSPTPADTKEREANAFQNSTACRGARNRSISMCALIAVCGCSSLDGSFGHTSTGTMPASRNTAAAAANGVYSPPNTTQATPIHTPSAWPTIWPMPRARTMRGRNLSGTRSLNAAAIGTVSIT